MAAPIFLVGLRAPECDDQTLMDPLNVVAVDPTASERRNSPAKPIKSSARSRPVLHALAHGVQDPEQVFSEQRLRLTLGDTARALDASKCRADDLRPARVGQPPPSCAFEIVAVRRTRVAAPSVSEWAAR